MTRARWFSVAAAIAALAALTTTSQAARAQQSGFAIDRFDPSERGSDFFASESLDLRGDTRAALGLIFDGAYRPLALYNADGSVKQSIVGNQIFAHLGGSLVMWNRVRFGVNVPVAIYQNGDTGTVNGTQFNSPGTVAFGDIRLGADLRILGEYGDPFTFGAGVHAFLPTGSRENYTGDGKLRVEPRLMAAGNIGLFEYAARAGVQYRALDDAFGGSPLGTELTFGLAAGLRFIDRKLLIGPEVFGSTVVTSGDAFFAAKTTPADGVIGAHYTIGQDWRIGAAGGPGLTRGYGSPVVRWLAGIEWAPAIEAPPPDRDHDGILDTDDACIDVPGVHTNDPKTNGCPPDRDHDGIYDQDDACPDLAGVKTSDPKTNGCPPDRDHDGIYDSDDACPDLAGVKTSDPKTNGCPPDRDHDGIYDKDDACPDVPGVATTDPTTNGCPPPPADPDRDHDGIKNEDDACPDEPGVPSPDTTKNGCPKAFIQNGQIKILDQVKFATASARIVAGKDSEDVLNAVLKVLIDHSDIKKLRVEGHTDNQGAHDYNTQLSQARAQSVMKWLVSHGIDAGRLTAQGFGPDHPLDSNSTPIARQNNRRVEFHIVDDTKP